MRVFDLLCCFLLFVLASNLGHADLLVCDFDNDRIVRYSNSGEFIEDFIPSGTGILDGPNRILEGPKGDFFVSSSNNNSILRYSATGQFLGNFALGGNLVEIQSLRFGPDGDLYVGDNGDLKQFDGENGLFIRTAINLSGDLNEIRFEPGSGNVVIKSNDDVARYEIDFEDQQNDNSLFFVDFNGNGRFVFGPGLGVEDDIYLHLNSNPSQIHRISATNGAFLQIFAFSVPGIGGTFGNPISFSPTGDLIVGDRNNQRIDVFSGTTGAFKMTLIDSLGYEPIDAIFTGVLAGDVNGDGTIDLLDVQSFVDALTSTNFVPEADINGDGEVDLLDVAPFVALLTC